MSPTMMAASTPSEDKHLFRTPIPSPAISPGKERVPVVTKRSLTPRSHIFPSLQDAHRNITSRSLASNNPFRHPTPTLSTHSYTEDDEDEEGDYDDASQVQSSSSLEGFASSSPWGKPVVQHILDEAGDDTPSPPQRMANGRSLTDVRRPYHTAAAEATTKDTQVGDQAHDATTSLAIPQKQSIKPSASGQRPSGSTVERIYDHYAADDVLNSPMSSGNDDEDICTLPRQLHKFPDNSRDGAVTRFGFRNDEERIGKNPDGKYGSLVKRMQASARSSLQRQDFSRVQPRLISTVTSSQPPDVALPSCPGKPSSRTAQASHQDVDSAHGSSSVTDSQHLLDPDSHLKEAKAAQACTLYRPLRSPLDGHRADAGISHDDYFSDTQSSLADARTEDLFKYDNEQYRDYLRPIKERDVSTALNGMGEAGVHEYGCHSEKRSIASECDVSGNSDSSRWVDVGSGFFDPAALESLTGQNVRARDIKVVIRGRAQDQNSEALDKVGDLEAGVHKRAFTEEHLYRDETNGGDWVTVATSNFDRDSRAAEALFDAGIHATGSSIANISDCEEHNQRDRFGTRELVLQHPAGYDSSSSFYLRKLKDTKQTVLLPGTRRSRAGFPHNSLRLFPNANDSSAVRPHLSPQWSNPFRQNSYRRANAKDQFHFVGNRERSSKYDFRDSMSEYSPADASNQATDGSDTIGTHGDLPNFSSAAADRRSTSMFKTPNRPPQPGMNRGLEFDPTMDFASAVPAAFDESPASVLSPSFQFGFELMPLGQAQVRQKSQRDSGETDETESPVARDRRGRRPSLSHLSPANVISPPVTARVRGNSASNWHTFGTPRGPNSAVFAGCSAISPNSDQFLMGDERATTSPVTPATAYTADTRSSGCWIEQQGLASKKDQRNNASATFLANNRGNAPSSFEEQHISYKARSRRECWFYMMAVLSIMPFFAILVLMGVFNDALSWFTQGEAYRLTRRQRRIIQTMFIAECVVYTGCLAALIVYSVVRSQGL